MKPSTLSLFEQEMHDQVAAARDAVTEAEGRQDPLLLQAAQAHLEALVVLARRNGVVVDSVAPDPAPATPLLADPQLVAASARLGSSARTARPARGGGSWRSGRYRAATGSAGVPMPGCPAIRFTTR